MLFSSARIAAVSACVSISVHASRLSFALFNSSSVLSFGLEVMRAMGGSSLLKAIF